MRPRNDVWFPRGAPIAVPQPHLVPMPRPPRPDLEPEILLPDVREYEARAQSVVGRSHRVKVRPIEQKGTRDGFTTHYDEVHRRLAQCRRQNIGINEGLLFYLLGKCDQAAAAPVLEKGGTQLKKGDFRVFRLTRVGCRVRMSQQAIADEYGCSRDQVNRQISILRREGFIVNYGHEWNEFDASLIWRGDYDLLLSYREYQTVHPLLRITIVNHT